MKKSAVAALVFFMVAPFSASAFTHVPGYYDYSAYGYGQQQQQQQSGYGGQQSQSQYGYEYYLPAQTVYPVYYYPEYYYYYPQQYYYYPQTYYYQPPAYSYGYSQPVSYYGGSPTGDADAFGHDLCYFADYGRSRCDSDPHQWVYDAWTGTWY